jgi:hypothetical protein
MWGHQRSVGGGTQAEPASIPSPCNEKSEKAAPLKMSPSSPLINRHHLSLFRSILCYYQRGVLHCREFSKFRDSSTTTHSPICNIDDWFAHTSHDWSIISHCSISHLNWPIWLTIFAAQQPNNKIYHNLRIFQIAYLFTISKSFSSFLYN